MPGPTIECPASPSDTGAYQIAWQDPQGTTFRLEESGQVLYEGADLATTVTGRPEGTYSYRVATVTDGSTSWSDTCTVDVAPPSLSAALLVFGIGLLVCAATVTLVVKGHRAHRRGELG